MTGSDFGPVLVVGAHVADRWDVAWALHEAGIAAEQLRSADQTRVRIEHGRIAGIVLTQTVSDADTVDDLAERLQPDPATGEMPFLLVAPRATTPEDVVARVQALLRAKAQT